MTVLAGGPGTGKTTTVARLLALLTDQPGPAPRIALAAPTGKAAARLAEAVRTAAAELSAEDQRRLGELTASTLHRLLGWLPESRTRFRHDAQNHLPHDVIIVDEMSMVSLTMMARLLEATRPDARLILVGDPDQLSSVEAGAVLADIARGPGRGDAELATRLAALGLTGDEPAGPVRGVVQLTHTWRFGGAIDELARAIRAADADSVIAVLRSGSPDVVFAEVDLEQPRPAGLDAMATEVRRAGGRLRDAALRGDVGAALEALDQHRVLCAHRRGPYGVTRWSAEIEHWLAEALPGYGEDGEWYLGRPLLVSANDYELGLFNGDTGVVVQTPDGASGGLPARLFCGPVRPGAAGRGPDGARDDRAPRPGQPIRLRFGRAAPRRLAPAQPGAPLHGDDPGHPAGPGLRDRSSDQTRRPAPGKPRERTAEPAGLAHRGPRFGDGPQRVASRLG